MEELCCKFKTLSNSNQGPIVEISFSGKYQSATQVAIMKGYTTEVVTKQNPASVLFNFSGLQLAEDYHSVDAISEIASPLYDPKKNWIKPACVIAQGKMAKALEWLFAPKVIFGIIGWRLFGDVTEGSEFLEKRLETARHSNGG